MTLPFSEIPGFSPSICHHRLAVKGERFWHIRQVSLHTQSRDIAGLERKHRRDRHSSKSNLGSRSDINITFDITLFLEIDRPGTSSSKIRIPPFETLSTELAVVKVNSVVRGSSFAIPRRYSEVSSVISCYFNRRPVFTHSKHPKRIKEFKLKMVRFKNRWLLVEFFQPDQHCAASTSTSSATDATATSSLSELPILDLLATPDLPSPDDDDDDDQEESSDEPWTYPQPPRIPFLAPNQPIFLTPAAQRLVASSGSGPGSGSTSKITSTSAGQGVQGATPGRLIPEKQIYHSLKSTIVGVFGDAGWGKVGNSLSVKYFSQTTSLCIIRVARDHFRTVWGALSFMNRLDGVKVVARVVGCSGTLKKLYKPAEGYTTLIIAQYLSHTLSQLPHTPTSSTSTSTTGTGAGTTDGTVLKRQDKVRQGEVDAWRMRRVEVIKALRAVDEG